MRKKQTKTKFAREGCRCRICKKWLAKGKRKANQQLCCNEDSRDLTPCQKLYYKNKRAAIAKARPKPDYGFMVCDVCQKKVKKTDSLQKRCTSGIKGVLSECQREGMRRNSSNSDNDLPDVITSKRTCLKCGRKFNSLHKYNRICDNCTVINDRGVRKEYKDHSPETKRIRFDAEIVDHGVLGTVNMTGNNEG